MKDIYDLEGRLKKVVGAIQRCEDIPHVNKDLIIRFRDDMLAEGLSVARVLFYMNRLWNIAKWLRKDFRKVTEEELKDLVRMIAQMDYSERTKADYNATVKKFFKWLNPSMKLSWLRTWIKKKDVKLPEEILTREDVVELIKACCNVRDKAIVSVLYESGTRVGEFLGMRIKNVQFDKYGAVIIVHGKTGWRRIRLVSSVSHLSNWLEHHPLKDDPEAPLWIGIGTKNHNKPMSYDCLRMLLRKIARRAKVRKDVNPHNFRHSRATDLANWMTEAQMDKFFGWVIGSKMASIYVHLSGRDIDEVILKVHGKIKEETHEQLKPKICPICGYENAPEADFCLKCRRPLDIKAVFEAEERERELLKMMTPQMVEQMIQRKVEEILSRYLPQGKPMLASRD